MKLRWLLSGILLAGASQVLAHHSFSMFDETRQVALKGVVKEFQWSNPHTWIQLNVTEPSGKVVEWSIEGGSPNLLARQGWKRNSIKAGDQVEVIVNPLRDGQPGGSFVQLIFPDGRTLGRSQIPATQGR